MIPLTGSLKEEVPVLKVGDFFFQIEVINTVIFQDLDSDFRPTMKRALKFRSTEEGCADEE